MPVLIPTDVPEVLDPNIVKAFRAALSWGRTYGEILSPELWESLSQEMAQKFTRELFPTNLQDPRVVVLPSLEDPRKATPFFPQPRSA
jgi:hypothetical protein